MRKASQKRSRRGSAAPVRVEIAWRQGDSVLWRDRAGVYRRDVDNEHADIRHWRAGLPHPQSRVAGPDEQPRIDHAGQARGLTEGGRPSNRKQGNYDEEISRASHWNS